MHDFNQELDNTNSLAQYVDDRHNPEAVGYQQGKWHQGCEHDEEFQWQQENNFPSQTVNLCLKHVRLFLKAMDLRSKGKG